MVDALKNGIKPPKYQSKSVMEGDRSLNIIYILATSWEITCREPPWMAWHKKDDHDYHDNNG